MQRSSVAHPFGSATKSETVGRGPQETFASLSCAALQLHQTGRSLRAQNPVLRELTLCGRSVLSLRLIQWALLQNSRLEGFNL